MLKHINKGSVFINYGNDKSLLRYSMRIKNGKPFGTNIIGSLITIIHHYILTYRPVRSLNRVLKLILAQSRLAVHIIYNEIQNQFKYKSVKDNTIWQEISL